MKKTVKKPHVTDVAIKRSAGTTNARTVLHVACGITDVWEPSAAELETYAALFSEALDDPEGSVVATREGVRVTAVNVTETSSTEPQVRRASDKELAAEAAAWQNQPALRGWTAAPEAVPRAKDAVMIGVTLPRDMVTILNEMAHRKGCSLDVLVYRWLHAAVLKEAPGFGFQPGIDLTGATVMTEGSLKPPRDIKIRGQAKPRSRKRS